MAPHPGLSAWFSARSQEDPFMAELPYQDILTTAHDDTKYRRLEGDFVSAVKFEGQEVL